MGDTSNGPMKEWLPPRELHPLSLRHSLYMANMVAFMILATTLGQPIAMAGFLAATTGLIVYDTDLRKTREVIKSLEAL